MEYDRAMKSLHAKITKGANLDAAIKKGRGGGMALEHLAEIE